jgi:oligopeptide transport system substrate-binding protein
VNRESIARNILRGGQIPAATFTPPGTSGFTPRTTVAYDPERARALFAEAGYPGGKGTPTVDLLLNPSESHRAVAEAIQEMWRKELGFEVKLVSQEFKTMSAARRTGQYQLMRSVWIPDYLGPLSFLSVFTSSSGNNYTGWANPTYDQWLFEAARVTNESAREALLQKAEALLLDDCPLIPIYHYTHIFLKQPAVKNWHPTLLDHHPYKYVYLENP